MSKAMAKSIFSQFHNRGVPRLPRLLCFCDIDVINSSFWAVSRDPGGRSFSPPDSHRGLYGQSAAVPPEDYFSPGRSASRRLVPRRHSRRPADPANSPTTSRNQLCVGLNPTRLVSRPNIKEELAGEFVRLRRSIEHPYFHSGCAPRALRRLH